MPSDVVILCQTPLGEKECCHGPGYASPLDAMKNGPREKLLYVMCPSVSKDKPDSLATVDVDPESPSYGKVKSNSKWKNVGTDEYEMDWAHCSKILCRMWYH